MTPVEQSILNFIAREILHKESSSLKPDSPLIKEGILDSLALQNLVAFIEDEFDIELDDDYLMPENFESVSTIARIVDQIRQQAETASH